MGGHNSDNAEISFVIIYGAICFVKINLRIFPVFFGNA